MDTGINKDIEKKYIEAVNLYELEILESKLSNIDSFINLAFLYWEFATEHFEFNIPNNISEEWSVIGGNRFSKIIEMGLEKYPYSLELNFWKKYFYYRLFNQEFSEDDCQRLFKIFNNDKSLVPYFYLYLFEKQKNKSEIFELLEICNKYPTAKNLYIKSIIGQNG